MRNDKRYSRRGEMKTIKKKLQKQKSWTRGYLKLYQLAVRTGIEPATYGCHIRRSNHSATLPFSKILLWKQLLYLILIKDFRAKLHVLFSRFSSNFNCEKIMNYLFEKKMGIRNFVSEIKRVENYPDFKKWIKMENFKLGKWNVKSVLINTTRA